MKRRDIVVDSQGNHFAVVKVEGDIVTLEAVATKEVFTAPADEVTVVPGLVAR